MISLDSILKIDKNYYQQVFLKEYKYIEKKVIRHITDDLENSSDDFDEEKTGLSKFFRTKNINH